MNLKKKALKVEGYFAKQQSRKTLILYLLKIIFQLLATCWREEEEEEE